MSELGKTFLTIGLVLTGLGVAMLLAGRIGLPLGRLPGDLHWRSRSGQTQVYFEYGTTTGYGSFSQTNTVSGSVGNVEVAGTIQSEGKRLFHFRVGSLSSIA